MGKTLKDITAVIPNWKTARMTRGAVASLQKNYPMINILISDDGSNDTHGDYNRAYGRDAYYSDGKLDLDNDKLRSIPGTTFIEFKNHQGHGLTLDKMVKHVKTPLMLTMDSDMRIIGPGLLEEYLEKYNEDPDNIYAVGIEISEHWGYFKDGKTTTWRFTWVTPCFSLWNMEPLKRYERLSFTNFICPSMHLGTAGLLNWQLQHLDRCHADREPYYEVRYPEPNKVPQLWHLRRNPNDPPDNERAQKWEELIDG